MKRIGVGKKVGVGVRQGRSNVAVKAALWTSPTQIVKQKRAD